MLLEKFYLPLLAPPVLWSMVKASFSIAGDTPTYLGTTEPCALVFPMSPGE